VPVRLIPCLLVDQRRLVKTTRFAKPKYVGDPINAVRIFNDKEVDEIFVIDIGATGGARPVDTALVDDLAGEAFMPMCFGGGLITEDSVERVIGAGVEKVSFNTAAVEQPAVVEWAARELGSQSVVASMDVRRRRLRRASVWIRGGRVDTGRDPVEHARRLVDLGAGEIVVGSIDRDGTGDGYDVDTIAAVAAAVPVPVVALGGAGSLDHTIAAHRAGASAAAAGSMFVFHGPRRAVLISYPDASQRAAVAAALHGGPGGCEGSSRS
jgi:cyclase